VRREIESRELGGPRVIKSGRRGADIPDVIGFGKRNRDSGFIAGEDFLAAVVTAIGNWLGAGMPCPSCNVSNPDNPPRLPAGFQRDESLDDE
jgi:hypothetical protein